jgi:hypothetical protein
MIDTVGFSLYRSDSLGGLHLNLIAAFVPGQLPGAPVGSNFPGLGDDAESGIASYTIAESRHQSLATDEALSLALLMAASPILRSLAGVLGCLD